MVYFAAQHYGIYSKCVRVGGGSGYVLCYYFVNTLLVILVNVKSAAEAACTYKASDFGIKSNELYYHKHNHTQYNV